MNDQDFAWKAVDVIRTAIAWYGKVLSKRELDDEQANLFKRVESYRLRRIYFRLLNKIDALKLGLLILVKHGYYSWFSCESLEDLSELRRLLGSKFNQEITKGTWITVQVM